MTMKRQAFTLVECIGALMVTSIIVMILSFMMMALRRTPLQQADQPLDWYLCLAELESPDHQFTITRVNHNEARLTSRLNHQQYFLRGRDRIYLTMANGDGGYLPLFDDVKMGSFRCRQLNDHQLALQIRRTNGHLEHGIVRLENAD